MPPLYNLIDIYGQCSEQFAEAGLTVFATEDAKAAMQMVHASGKQYITPHVWPLHNDLTRDSYFWLFLLDSETQRVQAVIASRRDYFTKGEYTSFWHNHYYRLSGTDFGGTINTSEPNRADDYIYGNCIYLGDYFCNPSRRINQTTFLATAHVYSLIKWPESDIHYAYLSERDANRGQAFRLIMMSTLRNVHTWIDKPPKRNDSDVLVWINRSDLQHELRYLFPSRNSSCESQDKVVSIGTFNR